MFVFSDSVRLMEAGVSLVDSRACNSPSVYRGRVTQDMICAQRTEGTDSMCQVGPGTSTVYNINTLQTTI